VSILASLVFGSVSVISGFSDHALALVALGLQALLEAQSSMLVLWRFKEPKALLSECDNDDLRIDVDRDRRRESVAVVGGSILFIVCSAVLTLLVVLKISTYENNINDKRLSRAAGEFETWWTWPFGVTFLLLAILKWRLSYKLRSEVVELDWITPVVNFSRI